MVAAHFRELGIEERSIHRARHTFGNALGRAGVNVRVVKELMRHQSLETTAIYLGVDEDEKSAAIGLLGSTNGRGARTEAGR
jgi:integrase/recombinase XerD